MVAHSASASISAAQVVLSDPVPAPTLGAGALLLLAMLIVGAGVNRRLPGEPKGSAPRPSIARARDPAGLRDRQAARSGRCPTPACVARRQAAARRHGILSPGI